MTSGTMRAYYRLTKPGIVYGNALVAMAGFIYASNWPLHWALFAAMLAGLCLIIASACVLNNYFDRDIDANMARTVTRALVTGAVPLQSALIYGVALGIAGAALLFFFTNLLTLGVAVAGWVIYVFAYTPLKRLTPHALWVGALAGATPPVVGYVAVTNHIDSTALALFIFLCLWQVPHFLAIATYRHDEYSKAGVPLFITKTPSNRAKRWGRGIFYLSLVVLLVWCAALMLHK